MPRAYSARMCSASARWDRALLDDLVLSRGTIDRTAALRHDAAWLTEASVSPDSRVMFVHEGRCAVMAPSTQAAEITVALAPAADVLSPTALTLLGVDVDGTPHFVQHCAAVEDLGELAASVEWASLRDIAHRLDDAQAGLAVAAVALDNWRRATRWCASCGDPLQVTAAGWAQHCPTESIDHFPRTEPAVIVLIRDRADRALLGRQASWQSTWFSTFAGFVEAGESAEAALRREVLEETGVLIDGDPDAIVYLGSQPWPFPASLMLGYHAWTSNPDVTVDGTEIVEARWFTRDELLQACESGSVHLPPAVSISRKLIERWYGEPLPGHWLR